MNPIGIMQGRLSPPTGGRIQAFPVDTWREEFAHARKAGLNCIEWIYEAGTDTVNPLRANEGIAEIRRLADTWGVDVSSICADYYMTERLVASDGVPQVKVVEHLKWLLGQANTLGVRYIVLPFVDSSSLRSHQEIKGLRGILASVIPTVERVGVELHLETDLSPDALVTVLGSVSHPLIRANLDTGNSASLGHNPMEELRLLGPWLGGVHIKDRVLGDGTVPLGAGSADFRTYFRLIRSAGFRGPFILQAAREEGTSEVELAIRNRRFVENQLSAVANEAS
jgi:L-ribulose-5-phosphate 3-epimerase